VESAKPAAGRVSAWICRDRDETGYSLHRYTYGRNINPAWSTQLRCDMLAGVCVCVDRGTGGNERETTGGFGALVESRTEEGRLQWGAWTREEIRSHALAVLSKTKIPNGRRVSRVTTELGVSVFGLLAKPCPNRRVL
jgi:hypothetical protein